MPLFLQSNTVKSKPEYNFVENFVNPWSRICSPKTAAAHFPVVAAVNQQTRAAAVLWLQGRRFKCIQKNLKLDFFKNTNQFAFQTRFYLKYFFLPALLWRLSFWHTCSRKGFTTLSNCIALNSVPFTDEGMFDVCFWCLFGFAGVAVAWLCHTKCCLFYTCVILDYI